MDGITIGERNWPIKICVTSLGICIPVFWGDYQYSKTVTIETHVLPNHRLDPKFYKNNRDRIFPTKRRTMILKMKRALHLDFLNNIQRDTIVEKNGTLHHTVPRESQPLKFNVMWIEPWKTCRVKDMTPQLILEILMTCLLFNSFLAEVK